MKKLVIVALAIFLAMPVLSHAGAVNNKWDMTIGGFVQYHVGWVDQAAGSGLKTVYRNNGTQEVFANEFDNLFSEVQGRLNFMVKGPDAFGAKTAGRLEFDFLGAAGSGNPTVNAQNYGEAYIRHAYLTLDWANDQLLFGNTWYNWNDTIPVGGYTLQSLPNVAVPSRVPQFRWTHKWGKMVTSRFSIEYPAGQKWMSQRNDYSDNYTRSGKPNLAGVVEFKSDVCGKIGPDMLVVGVSGAYGQINVARNPNGSFIGSTTTSSSYSTNWSGKRDWGWLASAYTNIPIIPERQGNKAGALEIMFGGVMGQGLNNYSATIWKTPYLDGYDSDLRLNKGYAVWAGMKVWLHDTLYLAPIYTDQWANMSNRYNSNNYGINTALTPGAGQTTINRVTLYNLALIWDPNPAIRFGVEYTRQNVKYAQIGWNGTAMGAGSRTGTSNAGRFYAAYNF